MLKHKRYLILIYLMYSFNFFLKKILIECKYYLVVILLNCYVIELYIILKKLN